MKLLSINVEGERHLPRVFAFLQQEDPSVVCMMEAPAHLATTLTSLGYHVTFAPMVMQQQNGAPYEEGVLVATKTPHQAEAPYYYYRPAPHLLHHEHGKQRLCIAQVVLFATYEGHAVATTHFPWNPTGETPNQAQTEDLPKLLTYLATKSPHVLCGDFNIPRDISSLYHDLTHAYTDAIPRHYPSSLDRTVHRLGQEPALQKLFDSFMVDYLFTMPPYTANNVRLEFGISDHAAIVATVDQAA